MHSRLGLIACVSLILMSCFGPKTKLPDAGDFSFFKNPDSNRACLESNLSQWQLSGEFLHKLLRCASNRNADGGETLPASLRLLEEFDAKKMQAVLNFVLLPDPKAHSHEARYPYLLALSTVMDRGLTQARQDGLELSSSRLLDLQDFLKEFDPSRSKKLLTLWSQSGHLDQILAELGLFLETLEHDSLSALSHELFAGKSLGPHLLALGSAAFEAEELMSSLDAAMSARPLQSLTKGDQSKLLDQWRQPRSQDAPLESLSQLKADSSPATSFAAEMSRFSQSLQETDIRGFSQFLLSFWNAYRNLPEADRIYMGDRLVQSLDEGLGQQQNPMQWLLSIANDLSRMPASDLNSISDTLGRLLEPANDPTLDTLRSKIWSSQMQEALQELLIKGGPVPGCQDFVSPGLQDMARDDYTKSYAILRAMNQPQTGCQNQAPLKRAIETWSNFSIGRPCPATDAQCLELKERERDKDLSQSYWTAAAADINPELLQKLLKDSLVKARSMLEDDAFAWRNLGLASVALQPSAIDELLQSLQENNLRSVEDLAKWEGQLLQNPKWRDRLQSDPIEKLLALRISSLSSLSQEFHDLVPLKGATLDKASNQRAARIFAGIYNEGPLEAAVRSRLSTRAPDDLLRDPQLAWPEEIGRSMRQDPGLLSNFLFRFKQADSIFRNPEIAALTDGESIPFASLGSPSRYMAFDELGQVSIQPRIDSKLIQPLQAIHAFQENDNAAWGLWPTQLSSSSLVAKDIRPSETEAFRNYAESLAKVLAKDSNWPELTSPDEPEWSQQSSGLNSEFFDIEAYKPDEARLLSLYFLRHYHKLSAVLPEGQQMPQLAAGSLRGFFSAASLVSTMDADYALFIKMYPDSLRSFSSRLEDLTQEMSLEIASTGKIFEPTKINPVTRVALIDNKFPQLVNNQNFRILSTLNLLSLSKVSNAYYIQPLLGIGGNSCVNPEGNASNCPVELVGESLASMGVQYNNFIADALAKNFCYLIAGDALGDSKVWQARLGLSLNHSATCQAKQLQEFPVNQSLRYPSWLSHRILNDIFSMGRKAQLKEGLAQIPSALRFYKIAQQKRVAHQAASQWLRQSRGVWSASNAASQTRRQFYAAQFWSAQPNLINSYLDEIEQSIEPSSWSDFLAKLAERKEQGASQDGLHELLSLVIKAQRDAAQKDQSLLEMALQVLAQINAESRLIETTSHLIGNFTSYEMYDFVGRDLPLAMNLFSTFDWNNPGLRFSKFLLQRESLLILATLNESFAPADLGRFLGLLQNGIKQLGQSKEQIDLSRRFLLEAVRLGTLRDFEADETLSSRWNAVLAAWRKTQFKSDENAAWQAILNSLDRPLETLGARQAQSAAQLLELWLPHVLKRGFTFLAAHQQSGALSEQNFWSHLGLDWIKSIRKQPRGAQALAQFLAEPRLGFLDGQIWMQSLLETSSREALGAALQSLAAVTTETWRAAMIETNELLAQLGKALAYLKRRMVWREDPDHNAFRIVIDQLYALSQDAALRHSQIELLQAWLSKKMALQPE